MGVRQAAPGAAVAGVHGFAVALTSFVGRAGQLAEVEGLLGECRLVTVTGPGGAGKARLAGQGWRGGWRAGSLMGCGWRSWRGWVIRRWCRVWWPGRLACIWRRGAADRGAGWPAVAAGFGQLRAPGRSGCRPVYGAAAGCR